MSDFEIKLKKFIEDNSIQAKHLHFEHSCHSVAEAASTVGISESCFVKNICLISAEGTLIVAIVKGEDKVSRKKVAKAINIPLPEFATAEQVLHYTGYPAGGTPSFGYKAIFLIDEKVMEINELYTGGGSEFSLVKITRSELIKANSGSICFIRK